MMNDAIMNYILKTLIIFSIPSLTIIGAGLALIIYNILVEAWDNAQGENSESK